LTTVLFACIHNAGRSQMAAGLFNLLADHRQAVATSAGTDPAVEVHPEVVAAMAELGVDLAPAIPRYLTDEMARTADLLITMGCGDACPVVPGLERMDWSLDDPKDRPLEEVRKIRDDIRGRVEALLTERGWLGASR
jgi:arsenate reductase